MARARTPRISAELRQRETVKPLELFFDLVFVLAFTQCTRLMAEHASWEGLFEGMVVLAVLWWSWTGYAWLTSVIDPEEGGVRLVMIGAMAGLLLCALCVPDAFADRATTFAVAYAVVRAAHIGLFLIASREHPDLRHSVVGLAVSTSISCGLLLAGTGLDDSGQLVVWVVALVFDLGLPYFVGVDGWRLVPRHFAERHGLVVILALGESIVALGVAADVDLDAGVITALVVGVGLTAGLWWTYFDVVSLVTERRLVQAEEGRVRNRMARDSYSYLHLPMVAGIILSALGLEQTIHHVGDPLDGPFRAALLGGTALYLLAHVALRLRNARTLNRQRFAVAGVLLAAIPATGEVDALPLLAAVVVLLAAMIAYETRLYGDRRYRLRHGLEP
ncbi:MAG TPA: low temperature requirement protein A [Acidimicrobiales bacterium]|nr:low temperature requirement protein A [Acidimicrobiales bacterium]